VVAERERDLTARLAVDSQLRIAIALLRAK
jgi:hypothetical protein